MEYKITGCQWGSEPEVIDTAPNKNEAIRLTQEYRLAFGSKWIIQYKYE